MFPALTEIVICPPDPFSPLFFFKLFIYFLFVFGCAVFVAVQGLSVVAESGGYFLLQWVGFSLHWLLLLQGTGSRYAGFRSLGVRSHLLCVACGIIPDQGSNHSFGRWIPIFQGSPLSFLF